MTFVAAGLFLTLIVYMLIADAAGRRAERAMVSWQLEAEFRAEKAEEQLKDLLDRIQHPEIVAARAPALGWVAPQLEPDEIGLVGSVQLDPEYVGD